MSSRFLGIEIGGTKLQLVLGDEHARILERVRAKVIPAQGAEGIRAQIEAALPKLLGDQSVQAAAVGFGGPVNWQTGRIARSHQIEGWSEFGLATWLNRLIDAPVRVENDANIAALGEATHGAGRGCNPVFYVTLGSGVGGGLVVNGQIYHGAAPGESEIGHLRLNRLGAIVESRCSGWAVDARIRRLKIDGVPSVLCDLIGDTPGGEARHLNAALAKQDPAAQRILDETAADLAFALSHVTQLFHPEVIVIGGGLALVGEPLRAAVAGHLPELVMKVFGGGPQVRLASLGEDAVPVGCLIVARTNGLQT